MEDNKPIDGAEYISLEDAKRLKLPYFEQVAAGFPSPASDYQHESLDLNEKFVHQPEASYFVRVRGESMTGLGILDGDYCLADRSEEISNGNIVVAFVNGGLTVKQIDLSTREQGFLRLLPANHAESWVRATLNNVVALRTWKELNGIDCIPMEDMTKKKSICTSRSFPTMVTDPGELRTSIANFAARCAEKLRKQQSVAQTVSVFIDTNHFREDLPQYWNMGEERLLTPTNSTQLIVQTATRCAERIYRQGYHYKRAGVIVMGISPDTGVQTNFIDYDAERHEKMKRLDEALDKINREYGSETIVLGSRQYTKPGGKGKADVFKDSIKHDFRSPCYTTRWSDIPEAT